MNTQPPSSDQSPQPALADVAEQKPKSPCCAPARSSLQTLAGNDANVSRAAPPASCCSKPVAPVPAVIGTRLIALPGGLFQMGSDADEGEPSDGEMPARPVRLRAFALSATACTNREFAAFVAATDYVTYAEEAGNSFVFAGLLPEDFPPTRGVAEAPWWREVPGACWRHPEGPDSDIGDRMDHPVTHVCWHDALAFCEWAGLRLPTEAEWEYAARGGLHDKRFPWGDELMPGGEHRCNIWQGRFPMENTRDDGHFATAPVDAYVPNAFGLYNMSGNTWEWCADWFSPHHTGREQADPKGPVHGLRRVIRGGSFLCHESYCFRYRVAARSSNEPIATTSHMSFRYASDTANAARAAAGSLN